MRKRLKEGYIVVTALDISVTQYQSIFLQWHARESRARAFNQEGCQSARL
jgi:hypothetical protein